MSRQVAHGQSGIFKARHFDKFFQSGNGSTAGRFGENAFFPAEGSDNLQEFFICNGQHGAPRAAGRLKTVFAPVRIIIQEVM